MTTNNNGVAPEMTKDLAIRYLKDMESNLYNGPSLPITLDLAWLHQFPNEPAVYVLRENGNTIYVGETSNLKRCLWRWLTETPKNSGASAILNEHDIDQLCMKYIPVRLGRKELADKIKRKQTRKPQTAREAEQRSKYPNAYTPWHEADDEQLISFVREGQTIAYIAEFFQRNPGAIRSRIEKLELL